MSEPYVGEIRLFGFPRTPNGWQPCDGRLLPISDYQVLYTLLGTLYGGDGIVTFAVPDLRGRIPIHQGNANGLAPKVVGQVAGTEQVTLTLNQIPLHTHGFAVSPQPATAAEPGTSVVLAAGETTDQLYYTSSSPGTAQPMSRSSGHLTGDSLGHDNCAPTLTVSFCIAWAGIYPSQG